MDSLVESLSDYREVVLCAESALEASSVDTHTHKHTCIVKPAERPGKRCVELESITRSGYAQLARGYCLATPLGCTRQAHLMQEVS